MRDISRLLFAVVASAIILVATVSYVGLKIVESDTFKVPVFTGSFGRGILESPISIAYVPEHDTVYISDPGKEMIFGFDIRGRLKKVIERRKYGEKGFLTPGYITAYSGNLLVSDPYQRQLYVYNVNGKCESEFIETTMPVDFYPGPVATFQDGKVAVADNKGGVVYVFSPDGRLKTSYGTPSKRLFVRTGSLEICKGKLMILDNDTERIIQINSFGRVKEVNLWKSEARSSFPTGLKCDSNLFYIADALSSVVICYSHKGNLIGEFGNVADLRKRVFLPVDIEIIGTRFFILEKGNKRVSVWEKR